MHPCQPHGTEHRSGTRSLDTWHLISCKTSPGMWEAPGGVPASECGAPEPLIVHPTQKTALWQLWATIHSPTLGSLTCSIRGGGRGPRQVAFSRLFSSCPLVQLPKSRCFKYLLSFSQRRGEPGLSERVLCIPTGPCAHRNTSRHVDGKGLPSDSVVRWEQLPHCGQC